MTTMRMSSVRIAAVPLAVAALLAPAGAAAAASAGPETVLVDYVASEENIANPDRGFADTTLTHYREDASGYVPFTVEELRASRAEGVTQQIRVFYMEKFVDQPVLDAAWLDLVQADFDTARQAGVSIVPRFAYIEGSGDFPYEPPYGDAPLDIVLAHIEQLGPIISGNADVISTMKAGFIGLWGEWYYTDHFADPDNPGIVTEQNWADRRAVVQALLDVLPDDRMLQVRTMAIKQTIEGVPSGTEGALTEAQAYDGSDLARIGFHNDCFLASPDDFGTFLSNPITLDQDYLAADTRFVPMGGETCNPNPPRSEYPTARAEMERYHFSYLNRDYNRNVLTSWGEEGLEETARLLGYRFVLEQSRASGSRIELDVRNDGWAAPYNPRPAELVLTGDAGTHRIPFGSDARTWVPGTVSTITADTCSLPAGTYAASLALPSTYESVAGDPDFSVQTANVGTWDAATGTNDLGQTVTSTGSCTAAPAPVSGAGSGAETIGSSEPRLAATGSGVWMPLLAFAVASAAVGSALVLRRRNSS